MKAPRNPKRFSCTLEIGIKQDGEPGDMDENVISIATISGQNLLSLLISRDIGEHITSALAQAIPSINIDGTVVAVFESEFQQTNHAAAVELDQLVNEAVSPEMLEDEPEATHLLAEFRTRLLKSLEHVDTAIASLPKA